jgi:hypothetical protein
MTKHVSVSPEEAADRLAIRELVEAYAYCADRIRSLPKSCTRARISPQSSPT